jgi:hypothetical protein
MYVVKRTRPPACQVRGAVQADDGLAGAGGASDACRAVEVAADELRLGGVEEGHPVLDGGVKDGVEEVALEFLLVDQRPGVAGEDRGRDDNLLRRLLLTIDDREVGEDCGEEIVDADRGEPPASLGDVADEVVDPHDVDRGDLGTHLLLAREGDDGVDLARWEADLGQCCLGLPRQVSEVGDVVRDVLLAAGDAALVDCDVAPGLGVDDEHAPGADDDHVDLGGAATGPAAVGKEVVADAGQGIEDLRCLALVLGAVGDLEAAGAGFGFVRLASEFRCPAALAAGLDAC